MLDGFTQLEIEGTPRGSITFTKKDMPGALVEIEIDQEKISVEPKALMVALQTIIEV
jgi:hypothetical protein